MATEGSRDELRIFSIFDLAILDFFRLFLNPKSKILLLLIPSPSSLIPILISVFCFDGVLMAKERILIIDDEETLRDILMDVLRNEGYEVCGEASAQAGLVRAKETFFHAVLSDLILPDGDGLELLAQIKETMEDTCTIIMTGHASTETAVTALEKGVYDYLTKPLNMERVKDAIVRGLEKQRLEIENRRLLKSLKYENEKLEIVLQVGQRASSILSLEELARFIVERIVQVITCEMASLMTLEEDGHLVIKAARGLTEEIIKNTRVKLGDGISGWVAQNGNSLLVKDIEKHPVFRKKSDPKYRSKSFVSIPLIYRSKVTGVINVIDKHPSSGAPSIFTGEDMKFLSTIAHYVAIAIENARLFEEKTRLSITDALTGLYNHRYFKEHLDEEVKRVKRYSHSLSLIMLDIDHFKHYNDNQGHLKGDEVLRGVADTLRKNIREIDIAARYG